MYEAEKIQNKEMLIYSAERAVNEVRKLKCENVSEEEVYFRIGTAIQWLVDCINRLDEIGFVFEPQVQKIISGLKFVNNSLKHKPSFVKTDIDQRFIFPIIYEKEDESKWAYGSKYDFANLDNVDHSKDKSQFMRYKENIQGRDIIAFVSVTLNTIKNYYNDI